MRTVSDLRRIEIWFKVSCEDHLGNVFVSIVLWLPLVEVAPFSLKGFQDAIRLAAAKICSEIDQSTENEAIGQMLFCLHNCC